MSERGLNYNHKKWNSKIQKKVKEYVLLRKQMTIHLDIFLKINIKIKEQFLKHRYKIKRETYLLY